MTSVPVSVDRREALRYLGCRGEPDERTRHDLERAAALVEQSVRPRYLMLSAPLDRSGAVLSVSGTVLSLPGKDISRVLADCASCYLLCATLGSEMEALLRSWQLRDLTFAAILDACGSSGVENVCAQAERALTLECRARGEYLTDRYSPGYGDLPITLQRDFCAALDTGRRLGVSVTDSGILLPRKSVTALIGVSDRPQPHREGCASCPNRDNCAFRKENTTCAC